MIYLYPKGRLQLASTILILEHIVGTLNASRDQSSLPVKDHALDLCSPVICPGAVYFNIAKVVRSEAFVDVKTNGVIERSVHLETLLGRSASGIVDRRYAERNAVESWRCVEDVIVRQLDDSQCV